MAPIHHLDLRLHPLHTLARRNVSFDGHWRDGASAEAFILESWSQGLMVGALMIMACVTVANMRKGVLLHKLILCELLLAMSHGTFCFMDFNGYGWYLSSTASLLYSSWVMHNIVAWIKIRPFFIGPGSNFRPKTGIYVQYIYLTTLALAVPPIILQIFDNFRFFNNINDLYRHVRPYEPLMRDPWWIFTNIVLLHVIRKTYGASVFNLIGRSPRLGILLAAICLAMIFTIIDILASILTGKISKVDGINPYWKLSLVFKCLTDTIMLDDFKTELKKLGFARIEREEARRKSEPLASKEQFVGGPDEIEDVQFRSTNYARAPQMDGASRKPSRAIDPDDMDLGDFLTSDAQFEEMKEMKKEHLPSQGRRKASTKAPLGKAGMKVSHLPSLGGKDMRNESRSADSGSISPGCRVSG